MEVRMRFLKSSFVFLCILATNKASVRGDGCDCWILQELRCCPTVSGFRIPCDGAPNDYCEGQVVNGNNSLTPMRVCDSGGFTDESFDTIGTMGFLCQFHPPICHSLDDPPWCSVNPIVTTTIYCWGFQLLPEAAHCQ
jgi:hypothetical protein